MLTPDVYFPLRIVADQLPAIGGADARRIVARRRRGGRIERPLTGPLAKGSRPVRLDQSSSGVLPCDLAPAPRHHHGAPLREDAADNMSAPDCPEVRRGDIRTIFPGKAAGSGFSRRSFRCSDWDRATAPLPLIKVINASESACWIVQTWGSRDLRNCFKLLPTAP